MILDYGKTYEVVLTLRVMIRSSTRLSSRPHFSTAPVGTRGTVHVGKALTFRTRQGCWYGRVTMLDFRVLTPLELLAEAGE